MSDFKNFLCEERNPIPVGKYDNDDKMNVDHFVMKIENRRIKPRVIKINPRTLVSVGILFATQHTINDRDGFDDPVLPDYEDKPIFVNYDDDKTYIIDGHHRTAKAFKQNKEIEVYLFDLD